MNQTTPLMRQYAGIKQEYPDLLLLFRMGDFYEFFYEDAERAAGLLNITLTRRGTADGKPIPMAGVPVHAVDQYLARLVKLGEAAAICEQLGEADGKGPMRRAVTRVVTPGTLIDSSMLEAEQSCLLMAIAGRDDECGYAWLDLSRAIFRAGSCSRTAVADVVCRLRPAEILLPESMSPPTGGALKFLPEWRFAPDAARRLLIAHFGVRDLRGFGMEDEPLAAAAAGALLRYARDAYKKPLADIDGLAREATDFVDMTAATRRNLELTETLSGARVPTLYSVMNRCQTAMGARLLTHTLHHPSRCRTDIVSRHDAVAALITAAAVAAVQASLTAIADIERIAAAVALFSARPRDLAGLRATMAALPDITARLHPVMAASARLTEIAAQCVPVAAAQDLLNAALAEEPAAMVRDGGVIAAGYNQELDAMRRLQNNARDGLDAMAVAARQASGIESLRVDFNKVHGFFIEVPKAQAGRAPAEWQRRQTLKNAERFITPEMKRHEEKVLAAEEKSRALEKMLYERLLSDLQPHVAALRRLAATLAEADLLACFAAVAVAHNWRRPHMCDAPVLDIVNGRHPVVEAQVAHFVGNDLHLSDAARLHIVTGPNMGGKSTYLRQTAVVVILACCGAFVPADSATVGNISRIFTRIGAADDLAGGRSTFMVEMTEAAEILNSAAADSLVLLDEIGRGTSTFDGLALAWALAERLLLHNHALTLFATHYFELTALADKHKNAINRHLSAAEHGEEIVFLHRVEDGAASHSYGLQVARLAGVPPPVLARARTLLAEFERPAQTLPLFADTEKSALPPSINPAVEKLQTVNPDSLSPREAHELLYALKKLAEE